MLLPLSLIEFTATALLRFVVALLALLGLFSVGLYRIDRHRTWLEARARMREQPSGTGEETTGPL